MILADSSLAQLTAAAPWHCYAEPERGAAAAGGSHRHSCWRHVLLLVPQGTVALLLRAQVVSRRPSCACRAAA